MFCSCTCKMHKCIAACQSCMHTYANWLHKHRKCHTKLIPVAGTTYEHQTHMDGTWCKLQKHALSNISLYNIQHARDTKLIPSSMKDAYDSTARLLHPNLWLVHGASVRTTLHILAAHIQCVNQSRTYAYTYTYNRHSPCSAYIQCVD